jgi:hypothetical protein
MVQAFHFKGVQGAKTGTGGPLPGDKVQGKIAQVRCLQPRTSAFSAPRHSDWTDVSQIKELADEVRAPTGGIPIATNSLRSILRKTSYRLCCGRGNVNFAGRDFIAPLINMRFNRLTVRPLVQKTIFIQ